MENINSYALAIHSLIDGLKVRREIWPIGQYVIYSRPAIFVPRSPYLMIDSLGHINSYVADANDVEALDWKVINE